jgi:hypothetical protein
MSTQNGPADSNIPWADEKRSWEHAWEWHPGERYDPETGDFNRFRGEVLRVAGPIWKALLKPMPVNPTTLRERSRHVVQFRYYLDGVIGTAEHYLTAARNRATNIEMPKDQRLSADQIRMRMELLYAEEKRLVSWLTRLRESLHSEIIWTESELKLFGEEMRMAGYETR